MKPIAMFFLTCIIGTWVFYAALQPARVPAPARPPAPEENVKTPSRSLTTTSTSTTPTSTPSTTPAPIVIVPKTNADDFPIIRIPDNAADPTGTILKVK